VTAEGVGLIEFRLLGQVEAWREGRQVELGGRKQRAVLAPLLLRAGRVVSLDQLIDDLWPERPPARAAASAR
jgi:DNA-binding SARP family transcriptional activator